MNNQPLEEYIESFITQIQTYTFQVQTINYKTQ
jgi:hypothetical protein